MPVFQRQPQLLEAFRRSERWALEHVYRAYVRRLDHYLQVLARVAHAPELGKTTAIADSLQEVFVRAFSPGAIGAYDDARPYGPYLRRIAKNLFVDQLRAQGRALEELFDVLPDTGEDSPAEGDRLADPRVSAVLNAYLGSLAPTLLSVYEQRFVLGNSQQGSCAALGITRRKLRTEEARLMSGLRRALLDQGIMRGDLVVSASHLRTYRRSRNLAHAP
ncbi:MAG TPA: sigma-70 family RNA polymerase sigma factor [Polyangiaceae bacterium]